MRGFRAEEVAKQLGIAVRTVRKYFREGHLNGYRVGRHLLFMEEDVQALLAAHRNEQQPKPRRGQPASPAQAR